MTTTQKLVKNALLSWF